MNGTSASPLTSTKEPPIVTPSTTTTATLPTGPVTTPTPVQPGMVANCISFYLVQPGDGCFDIATTHGISLTQFYAYNPAVGECTNLWPEYYVCVGVSEGGISTSVPSSTATTPVATPSPIQVRLLLSFFRSHQKYSKYIYIFGKKLEANKPQSPTAKHGPWLHRILQGSCWRLLLANC